MITTLNHELMLQYLHVKRTNDLIKDKIISIIKNSNPIANFKEKLDTDEYKYI